MMRSNQRRRICARSFGSAFAQGPKARSAASIAPTASAWPKRGTLAMGSPVAGLSIGSTPSPTHLPSTRHWSLEQGGIGEFHGEPPGFGRTLTERAGDDYGAGKERGLRDGPAATGSRGGRRRRPTGAACSIWSSFRPGRGCRRCACSSVPRRRSDRKQALPSAVRDRLRTYRSSSPDCSPRR